MIRTLPLAAALLASTSVSSFALDLKIWVPAMYSPASSLAAGAAHYQELYDAFEAANPEINIVFEPLDSSAVGLQQILTAASAGNLPDAAIVDGQWVGRLVESDVLVGLNEFWPAEDQADIQSAAMASQTVDGEAYAVMFQTGMRGLVYRPSVLADAGVDTFPSTWDELVEVAAILRESSSAPVMLPGKAVNEPSMIYMLSMLWGLGGEVVDEEGRPVFFEPGNAEKLEQVITMWKQLVDAGVMPSEVSVLDEAGIRPYFYSRDAAIVGQSSSSVRQIWAEAPDTVEDLAVAPLPLVTDLEAVTVVGGFSYAMMATDPALQDAAWRFISFMTAAENLGKTNEILGQLPMRNSIWETNEFFANDPLMADFKALYDMPSRVRPSVPIYQTISSALTTELSSVLTGQITPAEAIARARDTVMVEYDRQEQR